MPTSPTTAKALLATSGLVLVAGAALAIAKPGDLGDDDSEGSAAGATSTTLPSGSVLPTTSTLPGGATTTVVTIPGETTTTVAGGIGGSTTTVAGGIGGSTSTTGPGSGLGTDGASVADSGTAATGMESMLVPGLALVAAAGAARLAARRQA